MQVVPLFFLLLAACAVSAQSCTYSGVTTADGQPYQGPTLLCTCTGGVWDKCQLNPATAYAGIADKLAALKAAAKNAIQGVAGAVKAAAGAAAGAVATAVDAAKAAAAAAAQAVKDAAAAAAAAAKAIADAAADAAAKAAAAAADVAAKAAAAAAQLIADKKAAALAAAQAVAAKAAGAVNAVQNAIQNAAKLARENLVYVSKAGPSGSGFNQPGYVAGLQTQINSFLSTAGANGIVGLLPPELAEAGVGVTQVVTLGLDSFLGVQLTGSVKLADGRTLEDVPLTGLATAFAEYAAEEDPSPAAPPAAAPTKYAWDIKLNSAPSGQTQLPVVVAAAATALYLL